MNKKANLEGFGKIVLWIVVLIVLLWGVYYLLNFLTGM